MRISDDKAADAAGVGRQEVDCRELAARLGWEVTKVYVENDTSAYKRRQVRLPDGTVASRVVRPAFRQLLEDLSSGAVNALVAYDLDRVARDPYDLEDLAVALERRRAPARSVTGSLDLSTDAGLTMARIMVAVANKASMDTARRVVRKQQELAEQGRFKGGGLRPFGYEPDGMTVRPDEAAAVRDMAARLLAGDSLNAVARHLDATGVSPVRGGKWASRSVHSAVTKPRVAALRTHRGEIVGPAAWPAILDRDTWERVLVVLGDRARGSTNQLERWLTGVLLCGRCEHPLQGSAGASAGRGPRYWCATTRGGCGKIAIDARGSESFLQELLLRYLEEPASLRQLQRATSAETTAATREEVDRDQAQLLELADLWSARTLSTAEYLRARGGIEKRLDRAQALLRAQLPTAARDLLGHQDVRAAWETYRPQQRREVARVIFPGGIRVTPADVTKARAFQPDRLLPVGWS